VADRGSGTFGGPWLGDLGDAQPGERVGAGCQGDNCHADTVRCLPERWAVAGVLADSAAQRSNTALCRLESERHSEPEELPLLVTVIDECQAQHGAAFADELARRPRTTDRPARRAVRPGPLETGLLVAAGPEIGRRVHPATGRTMIYMAARPTHGTDIFVGDTDELADVRWASLAEAEELMRPYGIFGPVREHLARFLH